MFVFGAFPSTPTNSTTCFVAFSTSFIYFSTSKTRLCPGANLSASIFILGSTANFPSTS